MSTKDIDTLDSRYQGVNCDPDLPDIIRLPDGREFSVTELMSQSRREHRHGTVKSFNRNPTREPKVGAFKPKYSEEETAWLLKASLEEVQERYKIDRPAALGKLRYVYSKLGMKYKIVDRKPDKRTHPK